MARQKTIKNRPKKGVNYSKNLKKLKALGIAPEIHANRTNFTPQQKRHISLLYNRFEKEADFAKKPKRYVKGTTPGQLSTYTSRTVKSRADLKRLKQQGYAVYKNKVLIKHHPSERPLVKYQKTVLTGDKPVLTIELTSPTKTKRVLVSHQEYILTALKRMQNERLPKGVKVTAKIGENNPFAELGSAGVSYKSLLNYLSAWKPKDMQRYIDKGVMTKKEAAQFRLALLREMALVTIR